MATHIVSFRIDYDATHSARWSSTVQAIRDLADNGKTWEETTSLIILKSSLSAEEIARSVYYESTFDPAKDSLLVVNSSANVHATRGKIDYPATLAGMFTPTNGLASLFGA